MARAIHKLNARRLETLGDPGWHGDGGGLWLSTAEQNPAGAAE